MERAILTITPENIITIWIMVLILFFGGAIIKTLWSGYGGSLSGSGARQPTSAQGGLA